MKLDCSMTTHLRLKMFSVYSRIQDNSVSIGGIVSPQPSQYGSVSIGLVLNIGLGYGVVGRGPIPDRAMMGLFPSPPRPDQLGSPPKRPGREADHSPPSGAEVKNACS
jgi:hypothetical protein